MVKDNPFLDEYRARTARSAELYERARRVMPGGSTRGSIYFQPYPAYAARAAGCRIWDADGNERIDFMNNFTTLILGHAHPRVVEAVTQQILRSTVYGAPTEAEVELAELVCQRVPSIDKVVYTTTGSEAVLAALRLARAHTGRWLIAKFEGHYHGSYDYAKVSSSPPLDAAGDSLWPASLPDSAGISPRVVDEVVVMAFNDRESVQQVLGARGREVAAVIVEPVVGHGVIVPEPGFLRFLEAEARRHGCLLIFDEIISQRLAPGGAQECHGVTPDLTTLAKVVGGGFPLGMVGGRAEIMDGFDNSELRPLVYHSGTFNANPVSVTAGLATLRELTPDTYRHLNALGEAARQGLREVLARREVAGQITGEGSLFGIHFTESPVLDYRSYAATDHHLLRAAFMGLLNRGIFLASRGLGCISAPMARAEIDRLVEAFDAVVAKLPAASRK